MKAKFYVILVETTMVGSETNKEEKESFHYGGINNFEGNERLVKTNIPSAVKFYDKQLALDTCELLLETLEIDTFLLLGLGEKEDISVELYVEEIEANYQINSVVKY